jgi:urease accessory protein UreH
VIAHAYAEPPLRVGATFACDDTASLILVCSGPGIFAGDALHQSIHVQNGARVVLTSQSALQVHPACADAPADATARIDYTYRVDAGAELHCLWDPLIPFAGACVEQRYTIDVAEGGRLFWADALMSGRASRGETWAFERLAHELRVRIGGQLTYLERYTLEPRHGAPHLALRTPNYFSTVMMHHPELTGEHVEQLHHALGPDAGVDMISDRVLLARLTSTDGVSFAAARRDVRQFARSSIFQLPAAADRR